MIVRAVILLNLAVYVLWHYPIVDWDMPAHFTASWQGAVIEGRYWTLLTTVFSHNMLFHFLLNMFVLHSFGSLIEEVLGSIRFLRFYLLAGFSGSVVHVLVSRFLLHLPDQAALGASGAVAGLVILFSLMFPREKILIMAILPVPAIFGALLLIGIDLWGLWAQAAGGGLPIGHGAHLGGAFFGAYYFWRSPRHHQPFV